MPAPAGRENGTVGTAASQASASRPHAAHTPAPLSLDTGPLKRLVPKARCAGPSHHVPKGTSQVTLSIVRMLAQIGSEGG